MRLAYILVFSRFIYKKVNEPMSNALNRLIHSLVKAKFPEKVLYTKLQEKRPLAKAILDKANERKIPLVRKRSPIKDALNIHKQDVNPASIPVTIK